MILVDGVDCKDGVLSDEGMTMFLSMAANQQVIYYSTHKRTRHERTVGIRGSSSSDSRIFCKKRRVAPRMYSFGCCYDRGQTLGMALEARSDEPSHSGWHCYKKGPRPVSTLLGIKYGHPPDQDHFLLQLSGLIQLGTNSGGSMS